MTNEKNIEILRGDPKKTLWIFAIPFIISLLIQNGNTLIDSFWVSKLGSDALAAIGIFDPIFLVIIIIGNSIGTGASFAIAKRIGEGNRETPNIAASFVFKLTIVISIIITLFFMLFGKNILGLISQGNNLEYIMSYAMPYFLFIPIIILNAVLNNFLRAEGAAKSSMYAQILIAVSNMILDPILIYGFNMGLSGAAYASVIAYALSTLLLIYWFFIRKTSFLKIKLSNSKSDSSIVSDLLKVSVPSFMDGLFISLAAMIMIYIINSMGGGDAVATYYVVWKIVMLATIPSAALCRSLIPIVAASLGAKSPRKIKDVYKYAIIYSVFIETILMILVLIFAENLVSLFSTEGTAHLTVSMTECLMIFAIMLPTSAWGAQSFGFFQGTGKGGLAVLSSVIKNLIQLPLCFYISLVSTSIVTLWWGMVLSSTVDQIFMGVVAIYLVNVIVRQLPDSEKIN